MNDNQLTDGEVLDLIYNWLDEKTNYELETNPILKGLISILEENAK